MAKFIKEKMSSSILPLSADGVLTVLFTSSFTFKNWPKEHMRGVNVLNCPSINEATELLKNPKFFKHFFSAPKAFQVTFKINEDFNDENTKKLSSVLNYSLHLDDKKITFTFESTLGYLIFWKNEKMKNLFQLSMLEPNIKCVYNFIIALLRKMESEMLDLPVSLGSRADIFQLKDNRNFNLLMIAAECGNVEVVNRLLSLGFAVNHQLDNGLRAIDIAWECQQQQVALTLLKADSKYPKKLHSCDHSNDLKAFIQSVEKFYVDVEKENEEAVESFISVHPQLRFIFNTQNESAAAKAIRLKNFIIYEIFLKNNVFTAPFEKMEELTDGFSNEELQKLKILHDNNAKEHPDKHLKILTALSKMGHDNMKGATEYMKYIEEAFIDLNSVPEAQKILKAVVKHPSFIIYFDFNRTSVSHLDPNQNIFTNGVFYPSGRIYIAAKDLLDKNKRNDVLGVMIHELTHFAILLAFKNQAKPYENDNHELFKQFDEICQYHSKFLNLFNEEIVRHVYNTTHYPKKYRHAELIARVTQLLVLCRQNTTETRKCRDDYEKLINYFENVVLPKVENNISSAEDTIQELGRKIQKCTTQWKNDTKKINELEEESINKQMEQRNLNYGPYIMKDFKPVNIIEIREFNGEKTFHTDYRKIDEIFLQPDVKNREIVIMSIIGEYRKGKSFFLDFCLRFMYSKFSSVSKRENTLSPDADWFGDGNEPLKGFSWKHGHKPDTKGIIFWPDVFLYDDPSGDEIAIILMDTQGLFEIGSTYEENSRIFGLSTLISSIQIINCQGVMREDQIEHLDMATNLTKFIALKQTKSTSNKTTWKPFQKLLFLIRDWTDEEIEGGFGYGGGKTYLKDFLNTKDKPNTKTQTIRKNIDGSFDEIDCFLLSHPGIGVTKKDFHGEHSKLDDGFVNNLKVLIESILQPEKLTKKSVLGRHVTGSEIRDTFYVYLKAFRDTELPEIENILQMSIEIQMKAIVDKELKTYQNEMNDDFDFSQENLNTILKQKHSKMKLQAMTNFSLSKTLEDEASRAKYERILDDEIEEIFKKLFDTIMREHKRFMLIKKNFDESNEKHTAIITELKNDIQKHTEENVKSHQQYLENMKKQNEQTKALQEQIRVMNITTKEKDEKITKIQEELNQRAREYEQKVKEQYDEQRQKFDQLSSQFDRLCEATINRDVEFGEFKNVLNNYQSEFSATKQEQSKINSEFSQGLTYVKTRTTVRDEKDLSTIGVWVKWSYLKDGVPENAVQGGFDENGPLYVIKFESLKNSNDFCSHSIGHYSPSKKKAETCSSKNTKNTILRTEDNFQILTHTNCSFVDNSKDGRLMIKGGYDDKGKEVFIARNKPCASSNNYQYIGVLREGKCFIAFGGSVKELNDFEILREKNVIPEVGNLQHEQPNTGCNIM